MTPEQNEPVSGLSSVPQMQQAEPSGGAPTAGQLTGQQRRRRRRRKASKGFAQAPPVPGEPAAASADTVIESASLPQPAVAPTSNGQHKQHNQKRQRQGNGAFQNGQGGQNGNGQQRSFPKQQASSPGNGQPQGARRKNKQRRQAPAFVGPMDHSYRTVNGNVADGGSMEYRGGHRGQSERDMPNGNIAARNPYLDGFETPIAVREDAPVRILCFIEDLFVVDKLQETAKKLGVKVGFLKADKDTIARLTDTPESERPSLIVFDLNNAAAKPLALIPKLKAKLKRGTSVIGFLSHLQGDLKVKAIEAGCDMVMPKSAFSQNLPNLLRRHGLEEELEAVEA
jgi:hypothetical protein